MGLYINSFKTEGIRFLPAKGKVQDLVEFAGAVVIPAPTMWSDWKANLVCVVDNGPFEAAAYCDSPEEMQRFARPDGRRKTWLIVPNAAKLAE